MSSSGGGGGDTGGTTVLGPDATMVGRKSFIFATARGNCVVEQAMETPAVGALVVASYLTLQIQRTKWEIGRFIRVMHTLQKATAATIKATQSIGPLSSARDANLGPRLVHKRREHRLLLLRLQHRINALQKTLLSLEEAHHAACGGTGAGTGNGGGAHAYGDDHHQVLSPLNTCAACGGFHDSAGDDAHRQQQHRQHANAAADDDDDAVTTSVTAVAATAVATTAANIATATAAAATVSSPANCGRSRVRTRPGRYCFKPHCLRAYQTPRRGGGERSSGNGGDDVVGGGGAMGTSPTTPSTLPSATAAHHHRGGSGGTHPSSTALHFWPTSLAVTRTTVKPPPKAPHLQRSNTLRAKLGKDTPVLTDYYTTARPPDYCYYY
jgi:hypothetical protein